jgi:hypothetical protein
MKLTAFCTARKEATATAALLGFVGRLLRGVVHHLDILLVDRHTALKLAGEENGLKTNFFHYDSLNLTRLNICAILLYGLGNHLH